MAVLFGGAASVCATEAVIEWDPAQGSATCDKKYDCFHVKMQNGQVLVVTVKNSLPGVYTYEQGVEDVSTQVVVPNAALPWPKTSTTPAAVAAKGPESTDATFYGCAEDLAPNLAAMQKDTEAEFLYYVLGSASAKIADVIQSGASADKLKALSDLKKSLSGVVKRSLTDADVEAMELDPTVIKTIGDCKEGAVFRIPAAKKAAAQDDRYAKFVSASDQLLSALRAHQLGKYEQLLRRARRARRSLLDALELSEAAGGQTVADKLAALFGIVEADKAALKETWEKQSVLLASLPPSTSDTQIRILEFGSVSQALNSDFTLHLKAKPTAMIPGGVERGVFVRVTLKYRWTYSVSSGVMFSGLVGDSYSKKLVVDERNPADNSIKRSHNELIAEERDTYSTEAAVMGVLYPLHDSFASNFGIFLGLGVDSNVSTRYYGGLAIRLGRVATVTAGLAMGKVKVLKENVDVRDIGTLEPGDAVRDKTSKAFVVGLTFALSQN
ncbi:MAG: hypothetical protein ABIT01_15110 [Thermoanaerobaculia bacterium]